MLTADSFRAMAEKPDFERIVKKQMTKEELNQCNYTKSVHTVLGVLKANATGYITSKLIILKTGLGHSTVKKALRILIAKDIVIKKEGKEGRATKRGYIIIKDNLR
jgi:Fic family protein